jgi:glycosyltransferase A (GT-A) superfamily protein (DUF2064 family)
MLHQLSIIIPLAKDDQVSEKLLFDLKNNFSTSEIIIIGPNQKNDQQGNIKTIFCKQGRAYQLNQGAFFATKKYLWFLHADSDIELINSKNLNQSLKESKTARSVFFLHLKFNSKNKIKMFLNEIGTSFRSQFLKMPFGDQGFIVQKKYFYQLGLYDEAALYGEDHLFIWKARQRKFTIKCLDQIIKTSDRKYISHGWLKTTIKHVYLTYKQAYPEFLKLLFKDYEFQKSAVAIFVKTPHLSPIKTRLAKTIGNDQALKFYELSLKTIEEVAVEILKTHFDSFEFFWAVAEEEGLDHENWSCFDTISQGAGELGERIHTIYSSLLKNYHSVTLIGADCPLITKEDILESYEKLNFSTKFTIGLSTDGGFYLFTGKKKIDEEIWKEIPYSSSETAGALIGALPDGSIEYIETKFDIDEISDLLQLKSIDQKEEWNSELKHLHQWTQSIKA